MNFGLLRGMGFVLVAIITGGGFYFFSHPENLPAFDMSLPGGTVPAQRTVNPANPAAPAAAAVSTGTTRDPFTPPAGYGGLGGAPPAASPVANNQFGSSPPPAGRAYVPPAPPPPPAAVVSGIAGGNGQQVAIITYNGKTRTYGIGDMVGNSKVIAIRAQSVVLSGPSGQTVLPLTQR